MRSQAKQLQDALAEEKITVEKHGITVTIDGNLRIISLELPDNIDDAAQLSRTLTTMINDGLKQAQMRMAQAAQSLGLGK